MEFRYHATSAELGFCPSSSDAKPISFCKVFGYVLCIENYLASRKHVMPIIRKCLKKLVLVADHILLYTMLLDMSCNLRFPYKFVQCISSNQTDCISIYIYMAPLPPALVYFVFPYLLGFWVNFLKSLWLPIATRDTGLTNQAQRFHENQPFNGHLFLA